MPRIQKQQKRDDVIKFDLHLEEDVYIQVELDGEIDEWIQDIHRQLLIWRNIPAPAQIHSQDISVNTICHKYKIDSKRRVYYGKEKRPSSFVQETINKVVTFVQRQAIEIGNGLTSQLISLKFLKRAFVLDEIAGHYIFRHDIAKLFSEEEIETALDKYFNQPVIEHRPVFPTFSRDVAIEHVFPLMALLLETFDIDRQLEVAIKQYNIETDSPVEDSEKAVDDAGFQPTGLDNPLDD